MRVGRAERVGQHRCGQAWLFLNVMLRHVLCAPCRFLMLDTVHRNASLIAHGTLHIAAPVCFVCVFPVPGCPAWCVPIPYPTVMSKSYHPSGIVSLALLSSRFHLAYYRYWPFFLISSNGTTPGSLVSGGAKLARKFGVRVCQTTRSWDQT